jgi:hypothetical protein
MLGKDVSNLLSELTGGDRRSIGRSNVVVGKVLRDPTRFAEITDGLSDRDPLVRMRCADVAEKVSLAHPEWLRPFKRKLLGLAESTEEKELLWHLDQMVPRLDLDRNDRCRVEAIMLSYLDDKSRIVQTFALQALADLSLDDAELQRRMLPLIDALRRTGSPAVRARARKLLGVLKAS